MQQMMGREGEVVLVNGRVRPQLTAAPGERERWRIVNACPSRYLRLQLDGQQVRLLSRDLGRLPVPEEITEAVIAPGNRIELLVDTAEGSSAPVAAPVNRGGMDAMMGEGMMGGTMMGDNEPGNDDPIELLALEVSGDPVETPAPVPEGPALRDLREEPITARHTTDFAMGMAGGMGGDGAMMGGEEDTTMMAFTINGREFDPDRVDTPVAAGTVEEWTPGQLQPHGPPRPPARVAHAGRPGWGPRRARTEVAGRRERPGFRGGEGPHRLRGLPGEDRVPLPHPRPRGPGHDGHRRSPLRPGSPQCGLAAEGPNDRWLRRGDPELEERSRPADGRLQRPG
ncbi:hypothetical protein [Janibacter limosus]|uniref:hypothetical protein n=1 Tax=Janibacter limosus TaxID=53458 RepID=UPI00406AA625